LIKTGDIAELKFAAICMELGYVVSKPMTQDAKYDLIVDIDDCLFKIQVKSTSYQNTGNSRYYFNCMVCTRDLGGKRMYMTNEVDFFAVYVSPYNAWYLIPIDEITSKTIKLYPQKDLSTNRYQKYRIQ